MLAERFIERVASTHLLVELPPAFVNQRVEVLVLTLDEVSSPASAKRRSPSPKIASKGETVGDIVSPLVPEEEWTCLS